MVLESFRKNQRWLMIIIATLVIISFAWFYNRADLEKINRDVVATMYGRPVRNADLERVRNMMGLAQQLGLRNLTSQDFLDRDYPWNALVLAHESNRLGLEPSDVEVAGSIKTLPPFQTGGAFDPVKYAKFLGDSPTLRGFNQKQLETVVRADLQFARVRQMLDASATVSSDEVRALYDEIHSKVELMVARLKLPDFAAGVTVGDDDVKKFFEDQKNKASLMVDARRKVKYIVLSLTDDEKKLPPAEKRKALQTIADQMESLSQAMQETGANFDKIAAGLNLTEKVKETPEFDRESVTKLPEANVQGFMQSALGLTPENPAGDVLQGAETFHFVVLSGYTPARALTLEEAKPQIVQILREERGRVALDAKANEARAQIAQALKDGKSFADAVTAAGLQAETFPAFSRAEPNFEFPDSQQVIQGSFDLADGEVSKPIPTGDGTAIVYVMKRVPSDEEKFATAKDGLASNLRMFKQTIAARQWLYAGREAAGLRVRGDLRDLQD
jgi:SurA N-terminal domain/PPIC-type PPIASE domain